jgi:hypothetical protein
MEIFSVEIEFWWWIVPEHDLSVVRCSEPFVFGGDVFVEGSGGLPPVQRLFFSLPA